MSLFVSQIVYPDNLLRLTKKSYLIGWNLEGFHCCIVSSVSIDDILDVRELNDILSVVNKEFRHIYRYCSRDGETTPTILGVWVPERTASDINDAESTSFIDKNLAYEFYHQQTQSSLWITLSPTQSNSINTRSKRHENLSYHKHATISFSSQFSSSESKYNIHNVPKLVSLCSLGSSYNVQVHMIQYPFKSANRLECFTDKRIVHKIAKIKPYKNRDSNENNKQRMIKLQKLDVHQPSFYSESHQDYKHQTKVTFSAAGSEDDYTQHHSNILSAFADVSSNNSGNNSTDAHNSQLIRKNNDISIIPNTTNTTTTITPAESPSPRRKSLTHKNSSIGSSLDVDAVSGVEHLIAQLNCADEINSHIKHHIKLLSVAAMQQCQQSTSVYSSSNNNNSNNGDEDRIDPDNVKKSSSFTHYNQMVKIVIVLSHQIQKTCCNLLTRFMSYLFAPIFRACIFLCWCWLVIINHGKYILEKFYMVPYVSEIAVSWLGITRSAATHFAQTLGVSPTDLSFAGNHLRWRFVLFHELFARSIKYYFSYNFILLNKRTSQYDFIHRHCVLLFIDIVLGISFCVILLHYKSLIIVQFVRIGLLLESKWLVRTLHWFTTSPFGIKLSPLITVKINSICMFFTINVHKFFLHLTKHYDILNVCIRIIAYSGYMGILLQITLIMDVLRVLTFHITIIHRVMALQHIFQLNLIRTLYYLFQGKKINILRNRRIDTCIYDKKQLLFGTALFAINIFLLPSFASYYYFFTISQIMILSVLLLCWIMYMLIQDFPYYDVMRLLVEGLSVVMFYLHRLWRAFCCYYYHNHRSISDDNDYVNHSVRLHGLQFKLLLRYPDKFCVVYDNHTPAVSPSTYHQRTIANNDNSLNTHTHTHSYKSSSDYLPSMSTQYTSNSQKQLLSMPPPPSHPHSRSRRHNSHHHHHYASTHPLSMNHRKSHSSSSSLTKTYNQSISTSIGIRKPMSSTCIQTINRHNNNHNANMENKKLNNKITSNTTTATNYSSDTKKVNILSSFLQSYKPPSNLPSYNINNVINSGSSSSSSSHHKKDKKISFTFSPSIYSNDSDHSAISSTVPEEESRSLLLPLSVVGTSVTGKRTERVYTSRTDNGETTGDSSNECTDVNQSETTTSDVMMMLSPTCNNSTAKTINTNHHNNSTTSTTTTTTHLCLTDVTMSIWTLMTSSYLLDWNIVYSPSSLCDHSTTATVTTASVTVTTNWSGKEEKIKSVLHNSSSSITYSSSNSNKNNNTRSAVTATATAGLLTGYPAVDVSFIQNISALWGYRLHLNSKLSDFEVLNDYYYWDDQCTAPAATKIVNNNNNNNNNNKEQEKEEEDKQTLQNRYDNSNQGNSEYNDKTISSTLHNGNPYKYIHSSNAGEDSEDYHNRIIRLLLLDTDNKQYSRALQTVMTLFLQSQPQLLHPFQQSSLSTSHYTRNSHDKTSIRDSGNGSGSAQSQQQQQEEVQPESVIAHRQISWHLITLVVIVLSACLVSVLCGAVLFLSSTKWDFL